MLRNYANKNAAAKIPTQENSSNQNLFNTAPDPEYRLPAFLKPG
jgi:hypothetical protein